MMINILLRSSMRNQVMRKPSVTLVLNVVLSLTLLSLMAYLFEIQFKYYSILSIFCIIISIKSYDYQIKWIAEEKSFFMLTDFLLQTITLFKHHPKLYSTLIESKQVTSDQLLKDIETWVYKMEEGYDLDRSANDFILKYPHFCVGNLVHMMKAAEVYGNQNTESGFNIIQDDIEDWIEDTYLFKQNQIQQRNRILILSGFALVIALVSQNMIRQSSDIIATPLYQLSLFIFMALLLLTLLMAQKQLSRAWIEESELVWKQAS